MIYIWQNPAYVLLQKLYNHNESRSEENKLTFPDDTINNQSSSYAYTFYTIYNALCLSNRNYYLYKKMCNNNEDDKNKVNDIKKNNNQQKDTTDTQDYNLFDLSLWSVSDLATILRECDILTRAAGREMDKSSLMTRMKQVYYNTESSSVYKPSPLGHNWIGFWSPYMADIIMTIATVIGTLAGVHILYTHCEHYHYIWNCSNWRKMYSLECYVLKKSRSYLEEMNYNLVYTTLCGLGIALTGMFGRAKAYATKNAVSDT